VGGGGGRRKKTLLLRAPQEAIGAQKGDAIFIWEQIMCLS